MLRAMRLRALALVLGTLVACKGRSSPPSSSVSPPASPSLVSSSSSSVSPSPDLALSPLTCANIQGCVEKCPLGAGLPPCAAACVARLTPAARPFYDALQACVAPHCAADAGAPCLDPGALGCKLCAMSHCGGLASTCLLH
jgi:hypothetical protein